MAQNISKYKLMPEIKNKILFATEEDIPLWMKIIHDAHIPNLQEDEHSCTLRQFLIPEKRALIMKKGTKAIAIMIISYSTGSIDFFAVDSHYKDEEILNTLLNKAITELLKHKGINIKRLYEGKSTDEIYQKSLKELGFAEKVLFKDLINHYKSDDT